MLIAGRDLAEAVLGRGVRNIAVLVAVGVQSDGHREILGVAEGTKEDRENRRTSSGI